MGGRLAEEVVFGTRSTGAENDMQQATGLARQMVTRWGMSTRLGPVSLTPPEGSFPSAAHGFGFGAASRTVSRRPRRSTPRCGGCSKRRPGRLDGC
jgi:ATP-dependent Zn protease